MNDSRGPARNRQERAGRLAGAADPELAQRQLDRLTEALGIDPLAEHPEVRSRLLAVLGASSALGDYLVAQPEQWRCLLPDAPPEPPVSGADVAELRVAYQRSLLRIAADDLTGMVDLEEVMARLTGLAEATLAAAYRLADGPAVAPSLAVVAMGKCGGGELNYVSDVDVIFVADDGADLPAATTVAATMIQICGQVAWQVDAALRPEGARGPLVRTLASHLAYYHKWARTWEFQALLKARAAAGDAALTERWRSELQPLIWAAATRPDAVADIRAMRQRIIDNVPAGELDREIKRGPGGLRDIEFAVQLLQLVHGRADESLRVPGTLPALRALVSGGYVGRDDGEALVASYRFLRRVEHRLQLQRLRRTHLVPDDPAGLAWLATALGYRGDARGDAVGAFRAEWVGHAAQVRRLHAKLLYRPLLTAVARVSTDSLRLTPAAASARLELLGFADPPGALRHLEALTGGVSRSAAIQRTLLPVLLEEFATAPQPDRGLLAYRQVSEALRAVPWYLRLLRDTGPVAQRLARVLGLSRYVTELLARDPEAVRLLADDEELVPRSGSVLREGFAAAASRHLSGGAVGAATGAVTAVRALRRRELLRIACADVLAAGELAPGSPVEIDTVGAALADLTDATIGATLAAARAAAGAPETLRFAIIGMGRLGGRELSYPSDADVLFVYETSGGLTDELAATSARRVAEQLRGLLSAPAPDPPLGIDADLRPEGRQGPLVRSLAAYTQYYARWSGVWEAQALLRARFVAGDADLGTRFLAMADRVRFPAGGLTREQVVEIRRIKARVEAERLPRGADPRTHTKLGRGGLADVEWTIQLLQLRHGAEVAELRTPQTLPAFAAARTAGLIGATDATALVTGWRLAAQVRNALTLVRGRPADELPAHGPELAGVAQLLAEPDPHEFYDHYLRVARHSRAAMERVFDG
ncbi:bifunctional [glutamine synthetase] adenylyltransferase/[glutamine synthetase]-adenylyl-L-tyrosine phosphorylase [Natronosporangium hydrolyticum]|uniref:bifunctional [glutamine synthetase] adenylyltransferase/[glutamine synthetase]-adenylyl-L-tyrosine phosphorylase n=1 Tax=Natronosporangium hydrolyticum TaxID=2811111 RepID=UPI003083FC2F